MSRKPHKAQRSRTQPVYGPSEQTQASGQAPVKVAEATTADDTLFKEWKGEGAQAHPGRRMKKKSFGLERQKLAYPPRAGFHRHWANDVPGRLKDMEDRGYAKVQGNDGKPVTRIVGVRELGGGQNAYLMEIPEEWYHEDKAAMHAEIDAVDAAIARGAAPGGAEPGTEGRFIPEEHPIRMGTTAGRHGHE